MVVTEVKAIEIRDPRWKDGQDGFEYSAFVTVGILRVDGDDWHVAWRARWDHMDEPR